MSHFSLATFHMLSSHMQLVVTVLDSAGYMTSTMAHSTVKPLNGFILILQQKPCSLCGLQVPTCLHFPIYSTFSCALFISVRINTQIIKWCCSLKEWLG